MNDTVIHNKAFGRINLCKNYLTPSEFIALCRLVARRPQKKLQLPVKTPKLRCLSGKVT